MSEQYHGDDMPHHTQSDSSPGVHQHLGRLEGRMDGIQERQTRFELRTDTALGLILDEVRGLSKGRSQAIGGGKALAAVGSVVAFIAGLAMWVITETGEAQTQTQKTSEKLDTLIELMETPRDDEAQ